MPRRHEREVVLVGFDGMQLLDIVGPAEVFDAASNVLGGRGGYRVTVATRSGRALRGGVGMRLAADTALTGVRGPGVDTLIVGGGMRFDDAVADRRLVAQLARISTGARRTCSVCTGAFLLGAAGVLNGRRATTHWAFCAELARRFPDVRVESDRIFVRDGCVTTAAGVTAGIDLALALVEEDHGPHVARTVARWIVTFLQRPGGQSQFSERLALPAITDPPLRAILDEIVADPAGDHRQARLARRAAMSERHLRRVFVEQTNATPARFVERVRVEAACGLLEGTGLTIEQVAAHSGFGSAETMRRAFGRTLGVGPAEYRRRFESSLEQAS